MSLIEPNNQKKLKYENFANINYILNDDCLIEIFKYLPYLDRLNIEVICKRWNYLVKKSWGNVTDLNFSCKMKSRYILFSDPEKNLNFILSIIKRSCKYITNVCLKSNFGINYKLIFKEILLNCQNINSLSIYGTCQDTALVCTEPDLILLFKNNPNLSNIHLSGLHTTGKCLLNIVPEKIQVLCFEFLLFNSRHEIPDVSKYNNLKKFDLHIKNHTDKIVAALNDRNCENISELTLYDKNCTNNNLSSFISKQKSLTKLCIKKSIINKNFLETLSLEKLQELKIKIEEKAFSCLPFFKNLTSISFEINILTDFCIKNLTVLKLKKLVINVKKIYALTLAGENYFNQFKTLELFTLTVSETKLVNIDNMLNAISKYKTLKEMRIVGISISEKSIHNICLLENLELLDVSFSNVNDQNLINVIDKLLKLKKLDILYCPVLSYHIFKEIDYLKLKRCDKNILEIRFNDKLKFYHEILNFEASFILSMIDLTGKDRPYLKDTNAVY